MSVQINGLAELQRQLQTLPARIERNVMSGAISQGINVFRDSARQMANDQTLRKAIRSRNVKAKAGQIVREVYVKDVFYAKFLEFGTASYYIGSGKSVRKPYDINPKNKKSLSANINGTQKNFAGATHLGIKPRPFMRPAFDQNINQALERVRTYVRLRLPMELGTAERRTITRRMIAEVLDES